MCDVAIGDYAFEPTSLVVPRGTTVRFRVARGESGSVEYCIRVRDPAASNGAVESEGLTAGNTFMHRFDACGTFKFRDANYGDGPDGMRGTVRVFERDGADDVIAKAAAADRARAEEAQAAEDAKEAAAEAKRAAEDADYERGSVVAAGGGGKGGGGGGARVQLTEDQMNSVDASLNIYYMQKEQRERQRRAAAEAAAEE